MGLRMPALKRTRSGLWTARKEIPADVRSVIGKREDKPTWPGIWPRWRARRGSPMAAPSGGRGTCPARWCAFNWRMCPALAPPGALLRLAPKQPRALWQNVSGERLRNGLHGYPIEAPPSRRGMFGHMRLLPPKGRTLPASREIVRLLAVKAARRM